jgi:hypothetical protein
MTSIKEFYMVIEKDEDGFFVDEVPALKGCYAPCSLLTFLIYST